MRPSRRWVLLLLPVGAILLGPCASVNVSYQEAVSVEAIAGPTLKLFWQLARIQAENPSVARELLATDYRELSEVLEPLGADLEGFREELARTARVRPVVLFVAKDVDPLEAARERGLTVSDSWSPLPPALLSGPEADTLILFYRLDGIGAGLGKERTTISSRFAPFGGMGGLLLAQGPRAGSSRLRLYRVRPRTWRPNVVFEHTRCLNPQPGMELVTKLVYGEGSTDSETTPLTARSWRPCELSSDPDLRAAIVEQDGRPRAQRPVIVASSYILDPHPGPLLADWVAVR